MIMKTMMIMITIAGAKPKPGARPARGSFRQEGWKKLCDMIRAAESGGLSPIPKIIFSERVC